MIVIVTSSRNKFLRHVKVISRYEKDFEKKMNEGEKNDDLYNKREMREISMKLD